MISFAVFKLATGQMVTLYKTVNECSVKSSKIEENLATYAMIIPILWLMMVACHSNNDNEPDKRASISGSLMRVTQESRHQELQVNSSELVTELKSSKCVDMF